MNLETMETALRRYGFDPTDPLTTWINAAMHDLENEFDWPFLESSTTAIAVPAKSKSISLPADFAKAIMLKDLDNKYKLIYYDHHKFIRDIEDPLEEGLAEVYTLFQQKFLQIWRVLQVETNFELWYQATTADLAAPTDVPTTSASVWPTGTHYPIVQRAAAIALMAENEEERAKTAQGEFDASLMRLRLKFGERELDEPTTVDDVQGYATTTPDRWTY